MHQISDLEVNRVDLVGAPASRRRLALFKSEGGQPGAAAAAQPTPAELAKSVIAGLDDAGKAELRKSLFPEVESQIAALTKSRDDAAAQVETLTKSVSDLQRQAKRSEYIALAKAEGFVFGTPEEHADRLLEIGDKMGAEAVEKAIERERAIAAGYKTSALLTEIGKSAGAQAATASAELDRRAKEAVAKSAGTLDYGSAVSQILREDKTLATQYAAEGRGGK